VTGLAQDGAQVSGPDSAGSGTRLLHHMNRTVLRYAVLGGLVSAGVPQQLQDGPLTVTELASRTGTQAPYLERALRAAAQTGLLRTAGPRQYELTAAGTALLGGEEADRLAWNTDPGIWAALGDVGEILRTGEAPFAELHGGAYGYIAGRPQIAEVFDRFMTSRSARLSERVAEADVFPAAGTVADLGGGRGTFTAAILRAHPGLTGILLDRERVGASARQYLAEAGVAGRCQFTTGDFFRAVPAGADVYLLASVIHNWDDPSALAILRNVRTAIPGHGTLLLAETPLPDDDSPHIMKDLDIRILTILQGGRERTLEEHADLLARAGFRVRQAGEQLIVAEPASR
jgi:O-methyltransferase domain